MRPQAQCQTCNDQKFVLVEYPRSKFEIEPCPKCADLSLHNGLQLHEKSIGLHNLLEIGDPTGSHEVLRVAAEYIIAGRGATFVCVFGTTGNAKSLWAKIIVAELCRSRIAAHYARGRTVEKSLFGDGDPESRAQRPGIDFYSRIRALVIDEAHAMNWRNEWVANGLQEILDARYEASMSPNGCQRQLTILISQIDPKDWAPAWLYDRLRVGTHAIPWVSEDVPQCLRSRPCPRCGGTMTYTGNYLACDCGHEREVEIFFPFHDLADSVRPILPPLTHRGWS